MKTLFVIAATCVLGACGQVDRMGAQLTGYSKICVDDITYLQFASGATVNSKERNTDMKDEGDGYA